MKPFSKTLGPEEKRDIDRYLATRRTCGAWFDYFIGVATSCGRPASHSGPHHPLPLALDKEATR